MSAGSRARKHEVSADEAKAIAAKESRNISFAFLALVGLVVFWLWVFFGVVQPMMDAAL